MKKGFTLIELLAVIIILGVIFMFVFPKVATLVGLGENKNKNIIESIIIDAAKEYSATDNTLMNGLINEGDNKCIEVQTLVDNGFIEQSDMDQIPDGWYSQVKVELNSNNVLEYSLVTSCEEHTSSFEAPQPIPITRCVYNGDLIAGTEYVNGQYTYIYMRHQIWSDATSSKIWEDLPTDGWSIRLTNATSTAPVTGPVCAYINDKPIVSMAYAFDGSKATSIDLSGFYTKNVINMESAFVSASALSLNLSSFDTSNVTNMRGMFKNCEATSINLSNLNTENVTNMRNMLENLKVTTLDLSSFDTTKVEDMLGMFQNNTTLTTLDLSSFDMSNVTNISNMFRYSTITTGYARTQSDANKLNGSSNKPSTLTFVVK